MNRKSYNAFTVFLLAMVCWLGFVGCTKQSKLSRHLKRAEQYYQKQDYAKADIEYRNVLRLDPSNAVAFGRLGLIFYEFGQIPQAYQVLSRASKLSPTNLEIRLKFGQSCMSARQAPAARSEALFILSKDPKYPDAAVLLADSSFTKEEQADAVSRINGLMKTAGERADYHLALGTLALRKMDTNTADAEFKRAAALEPNNPAVYLGLGNMALLRNDIKQADEAFKKAFDLSPAYSPRKLRYVDFKLSSGAMAEAKELLQQVTKGAEEFIPAWGYLAKIAYAEQKLDDGIKVNERILMRDPSNLEALLMNAKISLIKGDKEKSLKESVKLQTMYPNAPLVNYQLALAHLGNGDQDKAVGILDDVVTADPNFPEAVVLLSELRIRRGDYAAAIASLTRLLKTRPEVLQAHFALATAYLARRTPEDAVAVYKNIMQAFPKNPQAPFMLGSVYRQMNKPVEARLAMELAASIAPTMLGPLESLVAMDLEQNKALDAQARLKPLLEKTPKSSPLRFLYAKTLEAQTNLAGAEAEFRKIVEEDENFRPAMLELAELYIRTKRTDEALERLESLAAKRTNDLTALIQIGMLHSAAGRIPKAQAAYEKILAQSPGHFLALNNLATIYMEQPGQLDKALELAKKAREASPNSPYSADTLGWAHFKKGDYAIALGLIQESAKNLDRDPEVQYHLGMAHYMLGEEAPARQAFEKALAGKKSYEGREDATRRLTLLSMDPNSADPKVLESLDKVLDQNPSDPIAVQRLGGAYEKAGNFAKAASVYEKAYKANPKAISVGVRLVMVYANRMNKPDEAVDLARRIHGAAQVDPRTAVSFATLALRSRKGEDQQWALSLLLDASGKLLQQPEVIHDLALAQFYNGQSQRAELSMRNAVTISGTAGYARIEEARKFLMCLDSIKDPGAALRNAVTIQELLNKDPENVAGLVAAAYVYAQKGQHSVAAQALEKALARAPLCSSAMAPLAVLWMDHLGNDAKGIELGLKARVVQPDDLNLAKSLGGAVFRKGDFNQAVQFLKAVAAKRGSDAEVHYLLGMSYAKLSQKKEGRDALQKALQLDAKHKHAVEARKLVAELSK